MIDKLLNRILTVAIVASFLICFTCCLTSCTVVKEYEKMNLNDLDMELVDKKCDKNLLTTHSYREAASGGNGGKTGGGCGCN